MGKRQEEDDDYLRRLKARLKKEIKENQNAPTEEI
jgi:F0F1-type ATP synthase assembly protein I